MFRATLYDPTCIPDGHLHRVTYTRRCTDIIDSPDDEHKVARNMQRIEINKCKGIVHQVGYLLELYRDARSPEYKTYPYCLSSVAVNTHEFLRPGRIRHLTSPAFVLQ
jgi:hypothetical protein